MQQIEDWLPHMNELIILHNINSVNFFLSAVILHELLRSFTNKIPVEKIF